MEYISLGKLVDLKQGMAINKKSNHLVSEKETSLPLLRIADMSTKSKTIFMDEKTPTRFIASKDDLIYTRTGQVGLVFRNQYGVVHNNCFRVMPKSDVKLDMSYLYWVLKLKSIFKYANLIASGSAQPDLPHGSFKKIKIPMFDIATQKKISRVMDKYESLIHNNNKRIKILEQMAEELYKERFVKFRLPKKSEQDKCDIRKEWKIGKLNDIAKITGKPIKAEAREVFDYYVPIDCIDSRSITLKRYEPISNAISSLQSFKTGDILFGAMRPYFHKVCLAPFDGITRKTCFVINSIDYNYRNYVLFTLFQKNTIDFASTISIGSTMPYVGSFKDLGRLNIIIPDKKTITEFNKILDPILEMLAILSKKNENLVKQRDLLLPRLMSGKLEVK